MLRIQELIEQGIRAEESDQNKRERAKEGTLRGGNSAIVMPDGRGKKKSPRPVGKCHRQTLLRTLGVQYQEFDIPRRVMFEGGNTNEDSWAKWLEWSGWSGGILREEDIPTQWVTDHGVVVTGRPDIVLTDSNGTPVHGLELKSINSMWVARDVRFQNMPRFDHLVQAAHYSWQLGIPFTLCYTQYAEFALETGEGSWMWKNMPRRGEPGSEYCQYKEVKSKKTGRMQWRCRSISGGIKCYTLRWEEDGHLSYEAEDYGEKVVTDITVERIRDYYNFISEMKRDRDLGPRPKPTKWNPCDYCSLSEICDKSEHDYDRWLREVKEYTGND